MINEINKLSKQFALSCVPEEEYGMTERNATIDEMKENINTNKQFSDLIDISKDKRFLSILSIQLYNKMEKNKKLKGKKKLSLIEVIDEAIKITKQIILNY